MTVFRNIKAFTERVVQFGHTNWFKLNGSALTGDRTLTIPDKSGTLALTNQALGDVNLLPNSGFGVWSWSGLAQGTTGRQTDYEIGSPVLDDDPQDADNSSSWSKISCTMARTYDAGNGVDGDDYYYTVTQTADASQAIYKSLSGLTVGKLYKLSVYIKNGTGVWDAGDSLYIADSISTVTIAHTPLASSAAWTGASVIFLALETNPLIALNISISSGQTVKVSRAHVSEVVPGCVGANYYGPDWWSKYATLKAIRVQEDTTHCKGLYGVKLTKGSASTEAIWAFSSYYNLKGHYYKFRGWTVTFGVWVYSLSASNVFIRLNDGVAAVSSNYAPANTLTWLEVTKTVSTSANQLTPSIFLTGSIGDVAYISQPVLKFGDCIGEDNGKAVPADKFISFESGVVCSSFNGGAVVSSDMKRYYEAESSGRIPKGAVCMDARLYGIGSVVGYPLYIYGGGTNSPIARVYDTTKYADVCGRAFMDKDGGFNVRRQGTFTGTALTFDSCVLE